MDWKEIGKTLVSQGVPLLGGLLGGPAGAIAGKVVAGLFDADPGSPESVMNAIQQDPEAMRKLREFELTHQQKLQELQLEETKAFLADVQSARNMNIEETKATGKRDFNLYALAWTLVAGFFILIGILIFKELPKDSNDVIFMLFGTLSAGFGSVIGYFFGTSKSSVEKTELLAKGPIK
jgi:hypothetical protein